MALDELIGALNAEISKNLFDSVDKYELLEEKCKFFEGSFNAATEKIKELLATQDHHLKLLSEQENKISMLKNEIEGVK